MKSSNKIMKVVNLHTENVIIIMKYVGQLFRQHLYFFNPILFAICTSTFSKLYKKRIQWHVEECSLALCN
jgi:hypothetical protein